MTTKKLPGLSIFIPAYNDGPTIVTMARACLKVAGELADDVEVIIINDGSRDRTGEEAEALARELPEVRVIHHPVNLGVGRTMIEGFNLASKAYVFYTDGDAQYDVGELRFLAAHAAKYDLVAGYRLSRAEGWQRVWLSRCFHLLVFLLFGLWRRDIDCSFKLVRRRFLERMTFQSQSALADLELFLQARPLGVPVKEVGVHHYPRTSGSSQCFRLSLVIDMCRDLIRLRMIHCRRGDR